MFKGVNASDGFGIGVAQVAVAPDVSFTPVAPEDPEKEKQRYEAALEKFVAQTNAQIERMKVSVGEEAALIMGAHIEFAEDEHHGLGTGEGGDERGGSRKRRASIAHLYDKIQLFEELGQLAPPAVHVPGITDGPSHFSAETRCGSGASSGRRPGRGCRTPG